MGLTKTFYLIKKDDCTAKEIEQKVTSLSACTVYFKPDLKWLPIYCERFCDGCDHADEDFMGKLQEVFEKPIIAFSVFDSDFSSAAIYRDGEISRYACTAGEMVEEFMETDEYSEELPDFLCDYGIEYERLKEIWEDDEVIFEEDRLEELAKLLGVVLIGDDDDEGEDILRISSENQR